MSPQKAFILTRSITATLQPATPTPLIEQGGKRQLPLELQRKLPLQYDGKYTNAVEKWVYSLSDLAVHGCRQIEQIGNGLSFMTFLTSGAKASKPPAIIPIKFHRDAVILQISFIGQK